MEPVELSGGISSEEHSVIPPSVSQSSRGSGDGRGIWDTVFPAQDPGKETSPAFLGVPGFSVRVVLAHLSLCPRRPET